MNDIRETVHHLLKDGEKDEAAKYVPELRKDADKGDVDSQYCLGILLYKLNQIEDGVSYLEKAAQQKHLKAIRALLRHWKKTEGESWGETKSHAWKRIWELSKIGVEKNDSLSMLMRGRYFLFAVNDERVGYIWLYRALVRGEAAAAYILGRNFFNKDGYKKDKAHMMYVWAAKRGHGGALLEMARRYDKGIFVEKNLSEAHRLAKLAEKHGVKERDISDKISFNARNAAPSMIKPSGIDENPDEKLPEFLKEEYMACMKFIFLYSKLDKESLVGYDDLVDGEVKKQIAIIRQAEAKASRKAAAREKKAAEHRKSKERKDAIQGCGCLLAIIAAVAFGIWWWVEGFSMSAITDLWKSANKDGSLGTAAMAFGGLAVAFIGWKFLGKRDSTAASSTKKRWKFITLGVLLGFFGAHLAYAKRWILFLLLWGGLIAGNVMTGNGKAENSAAENQVEAQATEQVASNSNQQKSDDGKEPSSPIGNIGFAVWGLLWIGGTLFIKKDGNGCRM